MVDSIGNAGGPPNVSQVNRAQNSKNTQEKRSERVDETQAQDEVQLSEEAQVLQAEQVAAETRAILEEQTEETLSSNSSRIDKLL